MRLTDLLGIPSLYTRATVFLGGSARATYIREYVRPAQGARILDIGCGPADILADLPSEVAYIGFDADSRYIESAHRRFGTRGTFHCKQVTRDLVGQFQDFDIVMANGVLHHVDDVAAADLFDIARMALAPDGRVVTLDGCYVTGQSRIAKLLLTLDRGQYVRTQDSYEKLAKRAFQTVTTHLRTYLMRIPYTHIILECSQAVGPQSSTLRT